MSAAGNLVTVESHILDLQRLHPSASGDFTSLLNDIAFAAKIIAHEVGRAGLVEDILGSTGEENVQGEISEPPGRVSENNSGKIMRTAPADFEKIHPSPCDTPREKSCWYHPERSSRNPKAPECETIKKLPKMSKRRNEAH